MAKPSASSRGYGAAHKRARKAWEPVVAAGGVCCARCSQPIVPGDAWDLGHVDGDKSRYAGPEHSACNRSAGATFGNLRRAGFGKVRSRRW
jgi:hypothetical protein